MQTRAICNDTIRRGSDLNAWLRVKSGSQIKDKNINIMKQCDDIFVSHKILSIEARELAAAAVVRDKFLLVKLLSIYN